MLATVSDWTQVQNVVAQISKDFGKIDVFVANAGEFLWSLSSSDAGLTTRSQERRIRSPFSR